MATLGMLWRRCFTLQILAAAGLFTLLTSCAKADDKAPSMAALAPPSTVVYAELAQPEAWLDLAFDARWPRLLEQTPPGRQALASPELLKLKAGLSLLEQRLQTTWQQGLRDLISGGVAIAADPVEKSALLVIKAQTPQVLPRLHQAVLDLANLATLGSGKPAPLTKSEYRGATLVAAGPTAAYAILENEQLLILGNPRAQVEAAIDRLRDGGASLADDAEFQQAQQLNANPRAAWAVVRWERFRDLPQSAAALDAGRKNPGVESLLGGVLEAARQAPFFTLQASIADNRLQLRAQAPFDPAQLPEEREWFFAPAKEASASPALQPPGVIFSATSYRDFSGMWLRRDDLFDEGVLAKLTQADSQLALFFSGRDFGSQVLGELQPQTRLVVARQTFAADAPIPAIKLPAFALVLELKNPDQFSPVLLAAYQTIIGITNVDGVQKGRPQLLQQVEQHEGTTLYHARYLAPPGGSEETGETGGDMLYNFRPACATVGKHFIVASTGELAKALLQELKQPAASRLTADNTHGLLSLEQLAAVLTDNQQALITQNMLEKGNTRAAADAEVGLLLSLLKQLGQAELRLTPHAKSLELSASIGLPQ